MWHIPTTLKICLRYTNHCEAIITYFTYDWKCSKHIRQEQQWTQYTTMRNAFQVTTKYLRPPKYYWYHCHYYECTINNNYHNNANICWPSMRRSQRILESYWSSLSNFGSPFSAAGTKVRDHTGTRARHRETEHCMQHCAMNLQLIFLDH